MQNKEYTSCFLFFPATVGDDRIPNGLPLGWFGSRVLSGFMFNVNHFLKDVFVS